MIHCRSQIFRSRAGLLSLALGIIGIALASHAQPAAYPYSTNRPSILLIVADDLGYGELGCYGQTQIKTPNLDKLAAQGMRFTSCYAGSSVSAASRAALLTGKHTGHATIRGNGNFALQPEDVVVSQLLKAVDYRTGVIGEWGLGDQGSASTPIRKGFDEWFGVLNLAEAQNYYPLYLDRTSVEQKEPERNLEISENASDQKGKYSDDFFSEGALNFIRVDKHHWFDHYRPFFLYVAYTIPRANTLLAAKTGNGMETPEDAPYSSETWPQPEKNKAAMITRLDRYVGALMDKLVEQKIERNTIIIFTSANGPHHDGGVDPKFFKASGPFRGIKHDLYEGGIRVPFIVSWPAGIKPGTTSDLPCALWDIVPTVLQTAERRAPADLDGISILPTLLGQPQTNRHEFLYWEVHEDGFKQAVRMGDWKAVRFGVDGPLELYDLKTDLGEKTDVAAKNPQVIAQIETYLKTARSDDKDWPVKTAAETPKKEYGQ